MTKSSPSVHPSEPSLDKSKISGGCILMILITIIPLSYLAYIMFAAVIGTVQLWYTWIALEQNGVSVQASIIDRRIEDVERDNRQIHLITYRFAVEGERYEEEVPVPEEMYRELRQTNSIEVIYAKNNPRNSTLASRQQEGAPILAALLTLMATLFVGIPAIVLGRKVGDSPSQ